MRILIVEDEQKVANAIREGLEGEQYDVVVERTGEGAFFRTTTEEFDVILLDLGLPDMDGSEVIAEQRTHSDIPIIVLSARGRETDKVRALDAGADDFIVKPFASGELLARIRAALRRRALVRADSDSLRFEGLEIDLERRRALIQGQEVRLSAREHALLCALGRAGGGVLTHRQIIGAVWGDEAPVDAQFVRVLVGQLRQKVEADPSRPRLICTEPGVGYRLGTK